MPVEQSPISITPYQSTVPLVAPTQVPDQDLQAQQPQRIYSKLGGIAQFADTAMKGLLKGLQMKEQKKFQTAEAVMKSQDAGIADARSRYENLLVTKGAFEADGKTPNTETQAAYTAWQQAVNAAAAQRQAFAVPEKASKQGGSKSKSKTAPDGAPATSFGGALKQFFERNPQVLPELSITAWAGSQKMPYGQVSPEMQQAQRSAQQDAAATSIQQTQAAEAQRRVNAEKTYDQYSGLNSEEFAKLPTEAQQAFQSAKNVLFPPRHTGAMATYKLANGGYGKYYPDEAPEGSTLYVPGAQAKPGSPEFYDRQLAQELHKDVTELTTEDLDEAKRRQRAATAQNSTTTSTSTVDSHGNRTTTSSRKMTPAPAAPAAAPAPKTANGKMTAPPAASGQPTLTDTNRTQKVETQERDKYQQAANHYETARQKNDPNALANFNAEKAQIVLWKAGQIRAVGGDPWKGDFIKDPQGNLYGTMDGVNWVNIQTGYPYPSR